MDSQDQSNHPDNLSAETNFESLPADPDALTGRRIGNLRVLSAIASGGMATVYKAQHTELEVMRAVKVLKPGYTQDTRQRLQTEAKVAANLHHPNIVQIFNVGVWKNEVPYIEMELVDGRSLHDIIVQRKQVPFLVAAAVGAIVARALDFACGQTFTVYGKQYHGLVHRDIKPANILISSAGIVKLTDFGIALPGSVSIHTSVPGVMGTYPYASPEQINCQQLDHRSDIYSLGTVLYETITGVRAFGQKTLPEVIRTKLSSEYEEISSHVKQVPDEMIRCIDRCLELNPDRRYQTLGELAVDLEGVVKAYSLDDPASLLRKYVVENRLTTVLPAKDYARFRQKQRRSGILFAVSIATALVLAIAAAYFFTRSPSAPRDEKSAIAEVSSSPILQQIPAPENLPSPAISSEPQPSSPPETLKPFTGAVDSQMAHAGIKSVPISPAIPAAQSALSSPMLPAANMVMDDQKKTASFSANEPESLFILKRFAESIAKKDLASARVFVEAIPIRDGYYHLLCGRYWLLKGDFARAEKSLLLAQTVPSIVRPKNGGEALYYYALSQDGLFSSKPNLDNKNRALKAWNHFSRTHCSENTGQQEKCLEAGKRIKELQR